MGTKQNEAKETQAKKTVQPTYSVVEFATSPSSVGAKTPDMVKAAFKAARKDTATIDEAKAIVSKFKNKEVK